MRGSIKTAIAALGLFALTASADTITAVAPPSFTVGDVEVFVTITGTGLAGSASTLVQFSGPAGTFSIEPTVVGNTEFLSDTQLLVYVPFQVLAGVGITTSPSWQRTAIRQHARSPAAHSISWPNP